MHNGPESGLAVKSSVERKQTEGQVDRPGHGRDGRLAHDEPVNWGCCLPKSYGRETAMRKSHLLFVVCLVRAIMST